METTDRSHNDLIEEKKYKGLTHGLGIAGLVLGILTLLISFIPCVGMLAFIVGIIAVIVSVIGLVLALSHDHPKGLIIGGLITALLGCSLSYAQFATFSNLSKDAIEMQKEMQKELDKNNQGVDKKKDTITK